MELPLIEVGVLEIDKTIIEESVEGVKGMFTRSQLERMAEESNYAIIGINLLNEIVICNLSAAKLLGLSIVEILGKDLWQLMPDDSLPQIRDSESIEFNI